MTQEFNWIQLTFVDVFGTYCSMAIPGSQLGAATSSGILFDGSALEGRARFLESDMRLLADESTLVATNADRARVVCTVLTPEGRPWPGDPRTALSLAIEQVGELAEVFTAGAELEFYLLNEDLTPVDSGGYFSDVEGPGIRVARVAAERLAAAGIVVESCHHEAGPGQYEIDLAPLPAMQLADAIIIAKQAVRGVAADAGLHATFMARPLSGLPGSGLHLHQRGADVLIDAKGTLTDDGRSFVAGQLAHAQGLSALAAPTINSYRRLHAGPEAPSAAIWGHLNRAALIRVSSALGENASIEYRGADPTANPYLLVAGLLAAGASGLESQLDLEAPNDEEGGSYDPASAVRYEHLPRNLDEALDSLLADDVLIDTFDNVLVTILETGRRAELEDFRSTVTSWETTRYLDES